MSEITELRVNAAMDRLAILDRLKAEAPALREKYRIQSLAVFGSMARGDDREESDVDVLVTFEGKADFDRFMGLKLDLEDLFGRRVDLGIPDTLRPEMRAEVERDLIQVPWLANVPRRLRSPGCATGSHTSTTGSIARTRRSSPKNRGGEPEVSTRPARRSQPGSPY
jgi:predicted nucleotidyltransferase